MVNKEGVLYSKVSKKILNVTKDCNGYSVVSILNDNRDRKTKKVHHLVLMLLNQMIIN